MHLPPPPESDEGSVWGIGECHSLLAQLPFYIVLHSPVSEDLRGALMNSSLGSKGRKTETALHQARAQVSDQARFAAAQSLLA